MVAKLLDMAIGSSLEHHVHEGYAFLQQNCELGHFLGPFLMNQDTVIKQDFRPKE